TAATKLATKLRERPRRAHLDGDRSRMSGPVIEAQRDGLEREALKANPCDARVIAAGSKGRRHAAGRRRVAVEEHARVGGPGRACGPVVRDVGNRPGAGLREKTE